MKLSTLSILIPLAFSVLTLSSCKEEGCTDSAALNYNDEADEDDGSCTYATETALNLNFYPMVGSSPLVYNQEYIVNGRKLRFTRAQFYVSNIRLKKDNNSSNDPEMRYALTHAEAIENSAGKIDTGHYHLLEFSVGVDSVTNHSDPSQWSSTHPLYTNSLYSTYWTWTQGYVFIRLEGYVDSTAAGDGNPTTGFSYHIGNDDMLRNISLTINKDIQGNEVSVDINVDYAKFLEDVDFQTELQTHGGMGDKPLQEKIADKAAEAITLK